MPSSAPESPNQSLQDISKAARACTLCSDLPLGPRPIFQLHPEARILIVGQAPGTKAHEMDRPFWDPSGDRLRDWLGVDKDAFYDPTKIALMPMGFCYPGRLPKGGDMPPRPICAPTWHPKMRPLMPRIGLTFLVGSYAIQHYLGDRADKRLADTVARWRDFAPDLIPAPHPSPRNRLWMKNFPVFEEEVLPFVRQRVAQLLP